MVLLQDWTPTQAFIRVGQRAEGRPAKRAQPFRAADLLRLAHEARLARVPFVGNRLDDLVLAGEVAVDRAGAELRFATDVLHRGAVEAVPRETDDRSVHDLTPTSV